MTIASEIIRLQNDKAAICTAIENKGVTVGNVSLDDYAGCIDAISAGGGEPGYIDFLMVGGGGGGAGSFTSCPGGGGGGGGYVYCTCQAIYNQQYPVKIGAGGLGIVCSSPINDIMNIDARGGDTIFYGIAYGGGGGGFSLSQNGASGGGGSSYNSAAGGAAIYQTQGCAGNKGCTNGYGGGGGGASSVCSGSCIYKGGNGRSNSISGATVCYSGGGGGGTFRAASCAFAGGCGGGGKGGSCTTDGENATCYGGGGGGGGSNHKGGNGCQGVVIIRYKTDGSCGVCCATGGTITTSGGYTIHTFTSDGIFTPILG